MAGLELQSRHRVGGSVILVVQPPISLSLVVRVTSIENLEVEETAATIGEFSWR